MTDIFLPVPYILKNPGACVVPAVFKLGSTSEAVEFAKVITLTSTFIPFKGFEVIITGSYSCDEYGWNFTVGKPISMEIHQRAEKKLFSLKNPREKYRSLSEDEYYCFFPEERELYL